MSTMGCSCCGEPLGEIEGAVVYQPISFRCEDCERNAVKIMAYLVLTGQSSDIIGELISDDQVDYLMSQRRAIIAKEKFTNGKPREE